MPDAELVKNRAQMRVDRLEAGRCQRIRFSGGRILPFLTPRRSRSSSLHR